MGKNFRKKATYRFFLNVDNVIKKKKKLVPVQSGENGKWREKGGKKSLAFILINIIITGQKLEYPIVMYLGNFIFSPLSKYRIKLNALQIC